MKWKLISIGFLALVLTNSGQADVLTETFEDETLGQTTPTSDWYVYTRIIGSNSGSFTAAVTFGNMSGNRSFEVSAGTPNVSSNAARFTLNSADNVTYVEFLSACSGSGGGGSTGKDFFYNFATSSGSAAFGVIEHNGTGKCTYSTNIFCGTSFGSFTTLNGTTLTRFTFNWTAKTYSVSFDGITQGWGSFCTGAPNGPLTYFELFQGSGNSGSGLVLIDNLTVAGELVPPIITSFTAEQFYVRENATVDVSWATINATSCSASGAWAGALSANGNASPVISGPPGVKTLTLTCSGPGGSAVSNITVQVIELQSLAGPQGIIFGGDREALAEAAHVSETQLSFLYGILFAFIFGLIGLAAAGMKGGVGGALAGVVISLAIGILPVWFLFLVVAAFLLIFYAMRRGATDGF